MVRGRDTRIGLAWLMVEHEARLNGRELLFRPGLLGRLSEALGGDFKVFLGSCGGRLQGVVAFARSGNRGYVTYPGLLHENERAGSAYFNLLYYHPIRLAIELGLDSIAFGNGSSRRRYAAAAPCRPARSASGPAGESCAGRSVRRSHCTAAACGTSMLLSSALRPSAT
jgi:hypothetical protein